MSRPPRVLARIQGRLGTYALAASDQAQTLLAHLGRRAGLGERHELSLLLTDNGTMRKVNSRWRGIDRPTDVLSFPQHELKEGQLPPSGPVGDIVLALPFLRRAAGQAGQSFEDHLAGVLVHGLLHLLGFDHGSERAARRMRREETRLLKSRPVLPGAAHAGKHQQAPFNKIGRPHASKQA